MNHLFFPGTHDSGAYQIDFDHVPLSHQRFIDKLLYSFLHLPILKTIVKNWTLTQKRSVLSQLEDGVRLFDFRVGQDQRLDWYLTHTFLCVPLEETLQKIKHFTQKHPYEYLVINVKIDHPYVDFITPNQLKSMIKLFKTILGNHIIVTDTLPILCNNERPNNKNIMLYLSLPAHLKNTLEQDELIGQQDKSYEKWPARTTTQGVLQSLKQEDYQAHYEKGKTFCYASFNTTPDAASIVRGTLGGSSAIKEGHKMQQLLHSFMGGIQQKSIRHRPCGLIFDDPSSSTIQDLVVKSTQFMK